jgi:hypothetical protein
MDNRAVKPRERPDKIKSQKRSGLKSGCGMFLVDELSELAEPSGEKKRV